LISVRLNFCPGCLEKQREIDRLKEEIVRLKARLRYQERTAQEGPFGSSTPSAKVPLKANALAENSHKRGGAKPGHRGHGRRRRPLKEVHRQERVNAPERCPYCGGPLNPKGSKGRTIIDLEPVRKEVIHYELERRDCASCHRSVTARAPGTFAKGLFGNQFLAYVAVEHYLNGLTLGHLSGQLGVNSGSLWSAMHQLGQRLAPVPDVLVGEYRRALVKHADETSWRNDGHNGYAWLFCSERVSLFRFRQSRSATVAKEVFGTHRLPGTLVVDRYNAYNRAPCRIQYCYAHLLRDVEDLEKDFPEVGEVSQFVGTLAPLLADAMKLRAQGLEPAQFEEQARQLKTQIRIVIKAPAQHPGVQKIQNIFREQRTRLYQWATDPTIPADNNRAERELRPLVIARKISFGSQSDQGARTRETLMSVLHTLRKRTSEVLGAFKHALDFLAGNEKQDPYKALFDSS
jgi:transposase